MGEITKRLPDIEFDLICARLRKASSRFEQVGNVRIFRLGFGIPRFDGYLLALLGHRLALKLHKQKPYDLMWSVMASYGAFSAVRVKKHTGLPFLLTLQEGDPIEYILHKVRFVRKSFNAIFESADGLQPISSFLQRWGYQMGFKGKAANVIPNGVDITAFTTTFNPDVLRATRMNFGFPPEAFVLITSSRLVPKNGVGDIIEALPSLPNVCLVICGSGTLESALKARVESLGIGNRVKFLGFVKIQELPQLLKASDAFIRPSLSEGLGNAFLEAMAAEVPTMGTPVGGIPDFLFDGKTGFMCEPENPPSIVSAVRRVQDLNDEERTAILKSAHDLVVSRYDWDLIAKDMNHLFRGLTQK